MIFQNHPGGNICEFMLQLGSFKLPNLDSFVKGIPCQRVQQVPLGQGISCERVQQVPLQKGSCLEEVDPGTRQSPS
jgi:hypothetical protein